MTWQWTPLLIPYVIGALFSFLTAVYIYTNLKTEAHRTGAALLFAGAWWLFGAFMELGNTGLAGKVFWAQAQYLGIALLPTAWLVYAIQYTGATRWLTQRRLMGLMLFPLVMILAVFTNESHNLMWSTSHLMTDNGVVILVQHFNIGFWVFLGPAMLLMLIGVVLFVRMFRNVRLLYRRQIRAVMVASALLGIMGILATFSPVPFTNIDLEPLAFILAAITLAWGLTRLQIDDIVPVAQAMIIENIVDGIIVLNAQGRILDFNPRAGRLLGGTDNIHVGEPLAQFGPPWTDLLHHLDTALETDQLEVTLGTGSAEQVFDVQMSILRDGRDQSIGWVVVLRDVTTRKRIEREARERHRHLEAVWSAVPDAIVVLDADRRILEWNIGAERLFGYRKREALGQTMEALIERLEITGRGSGDVTLGSLGQSLTPVETVRFRKDGDAVDVIVAASPVVVDDGFVGAVFVFTDVTRRKRVESQVRALNEELESRVNARTAELSAVNAQLAQEIEKHEQTEVMLIQRNRELLALQSAAAATSSSLDLSFLFDTVTWEMVNLLQSDGCIIYEWQPNADRLSVVADYEMGLEGDLMEEGPLHLASFALRQRVLQERFAQQVDFYAADVAEREFMMHRNFKAVLFLPMAFQEHVIGLVAVTQMETRTFTDRDISLGQLLANQAATAVENARLYERAQQEITERVRVEKQIKASLKEKEILLQEIHHRVKNNLQVISSLLNLQSQGIDDLAVLEVFRESQHRIRSMALIHEKLYRSQDLARVDFAEYIRNLASFLIRSYRSRAVRLNLEAGDVFLAIDNAVPCGLIVNELISNSLKHAFVDGREGEIHVRLQQTVDHNVTLLVGDNGVGIPEDIDFSTTGSLGMQLVDMLVQQLEGTLTIRNNNGAEFEILFPGL